MPEIKKEVKTYRVDYVCDNCGKDYMKPIGTTLLTKPPKFKHVCLVYAKSKRRIGDMEYKIIVSATAEHLEYMIGHHMGNYV